MLLDLKNKANDMQLETGHSGITNVLSICIAKLMPSMIKTQTVFTIGKSCSDLEIELTTVLLFLGAVFSFSLLASFLHIPHPNINSAN
jgi:hypothetical protein